MAPASRPLGYVLRIAKLHRGTVHGLCNSIMHLEGPACQIRSAAGTTSLPLHLRCVGQAGRLGNGKNPVNGYGP